MAEKYTLKVENLSKEERLLNTCKERALYLLADMPRTEKKLREKLLAGGKYDDETINKTIIFLKEYKYIDDLAYAKAYVAQSKRSKREIEAKLYQRGVSSSDIKEALKDYSEERDLEAAKLALSKKCKDLKNITYEEKRKLYGYLARKGFGPSVISKVLQVPEEE